MKYLLCAAFVLVFISPLNGSVCEKPSVKSKSYTATDGTVIDSVAYIAEFQVTCSNNAKDLNLYADVNGKTIPAMRSVDSSKYQVSWTEALEKAKSGDHSVKIFDEEGFAALRKAQRSGEDSSSISPLFLLTVNHPGTYKGPWVQSELIAVISVIILWYMAYSAKSKMQA